MTLLTGESAPPTSEADEPAAGTIATTLFIDEYSDTLPAEVSPQEAREFILPPDATPEQTTLVTEFARHRLALLRAALNWTHNSHDAEDLVSETFIKAWEAVGSGKYQEVGKLPAYLTTIAFHTFVNGHRKSQRKPETLVAPQDGLETVGRLALSSAMSAEAAYLDSGLDGSVTEALRMLPEEYGEAVVLVCIEGYKCREAAEILGVPLGTVQSRVHRGRGVLKKLILDGETNLDTTKRPA